MAEENGNTEGQGGQNGQEGAGKEGDSLMTRGAQDGQEGAGTNKDGKPGDDKSDGGKGKEAGDKKPADDPADKAPDKPEGYALKFAESTKLDAELLSGFQKAAHELGLSNAKAQKLAALYESHAAKAGERAEAERSKVIEGAKKQWEGEIEKLPSFVEDRANIQAALRQYGDQELYELLDQTNLGSHPKMWAFMAKIGKALAEPGFKGKGGAASKSAAEVLYPNQGKGGGV